MKRTTEIKVKANGKKIRYMDKGVQHSKPVAVLMAGTKAKRTRGWPKKITCHCCFKKSVDFEEATFVSGGSGFGRSYFLCPDCKI